MPYNAYLSTGKVHAVQSMCDESKVIYVLDQGYGDYKSLYSIDLQGSTLVNRRKSNGALKRINNNPHKKNGSIIPDVLIQVTWSKTKKFYLRLIGR
jgi:hypothetical protein